MTHIKSVTSYGSGVIGSGWATNFLMEGLQVILFDIDEKNLQNSKALVEKNLAFLLSEGMITQSRYDECLKNLICTTDHVTAVKDADFIQENCPERLELKQSIIATMEKYCRPDTIIASSTSGLLVSDLAEKAKYPERIIGAHPYGPVHLIPLVEISKWEKTDPAVVQKAYDFYKQIKKEPLVLQKEAPGFISNRLQAALFREAADLVLRGVCSVDEVERAVCYGPGLRYALMGPHTVFQLAGATSGIEGLLKHIGAAAPVWFRDMAKWTEWPPEYLSIVQEKTDEAMAARPDSQGHTNEEISLFRDKGLLKILHYHGKL